MGANFYDHFKNKDLKNMFKRLCTQNQQRKFNALWQMLDQLTAELVKVRASGTGIQLRSHFHTGFEVHLRRNGHSIMIPTEYGMIFRQRTMQSVSIWLCILVVPFLLWELLSSSCMGAWSILEDVPAYSWGEAVLAATYRELCDGCMKTHGNAILAGCPLLLQHNSNTKPHCIPNVWRWV